MNHNYSKAGPLLTASLAVIFMAEAGLPPAHSELATMNRCTPSIVTFDGSGREIQRQMLKEIGAELARRNADIDGTVRAIGAAPTPSSDSEQVRAFGSRLEALSKAAHALEEQINAVTSTPITCNSNPKELSHE